MYRVKVEQLAEGQFEASGFIAQNVLTATGRSINGAIAAMVNKANSIGGWRPDHFDLEPYGVTGYWNDEAGRFFIEGKAS